MIVHLVKLAVGITSIEHLGRVQQRRAADLGLAGRVRVVTRRRPRRAEALLAGGSLYWVIGRCLCVRQRVLAIRDVVDVGGQPACAIDLDADLCSTRPVVRRPFQGWRYLEPADAPADLAESSIVERPLPAGLAEEMDALGLR